MGTYTGEPMDASCKKLWKLLINRNLLKRDLCKIARLSSATMAKLGINENVANETLIKVCRALVCDIGDIVEFEEETINKRDQQT